MIHPVLIFGLALQSISAQSEQHLQAGVDAQKQGHFDVAISEFRQAVELDPDSIPGQRLLGIALLTVGNYAEAAPHLEKAGDRDTLGIAQIETAQYQQAIANLSAALKDHPNNPDLLYYLGRAAGLLSKQSIDTLIELHPDSSRAHQAIGENYFVIRQMPQAEKEFTEALRLRPATPGLHMALGLVYAGSNQWPKAEEQFRAETKLQPDNAEAAYHLGTALLQEGNAHEARVELERANQLKPDMPETLYSLGKAASLDNSPAIAEKSWLHLFEIEKDTSLAGQTHFALAALYRKQGNAAKAESEMREFKKLQKGQSPPPR